MAAAAAVDAVDDRVGDARGGGHAVASHAMRVVGGSARGRRLSAPAGLSTRPTSDRVRESVFNMLMSLDAVDGAVVADLFAGSGGLGIEALSRGAASCVFVDDDAWAVRVIRSNLDQTGLNGGSVVRADVLRWVQGAGRFDLVFCDPPYAFSGWTALLEALDAGLVVAESDREVEAPDGWEVLKTRRYGGTVVTLISRKKGAA